MISPDKIQLVLLTFPIFLFSLTLHEFAHAVTAKWGGDLTAAYQGRVSLSPVTHIDILGTIIMPIAGGLSGIPLIGWARPVPVVDMNFKRGDGYGAIVALAGPFTNLLIALFTVPIAMIYTLVVAQFFPEFTSSNGHLITIQFFFWMIFINMALMFFNLIPLPPLDGSHLLWHWVVKGRPQFYGMFETLQQYKFMLLLILLFTGAFGTFLFATAMPIANFLFNLSLILV